MIGKGIFPISLPQRAPFLVGAFLTLGITQVEHKIRRVLTGQREQTAQYGDLHRHAEALSHIHTVTNLERQVQPVGSTAKVATELTAVTICDSQRHGAVLPMQVLHDALEHVDPAQDGSHLALVAIPDDVSACQVGVIVQRACIKFLDQCKVMRYGMIPRANGCPVQGTPQSTGTRLR